MSPVKIAAVPIVRERKAARTAQAVGDLPRPLVRRRESRWLRGALLFVTCVVLADALFGDWGLAQTMRARRDYDQAMSNLVALKQENAALREEARRLVDDAGTIELVAREELGLIRPGEILVVVKDLR